MAINVRIMNSVHGIDSSFYLCSHYTVPESIEWFIKGQAFTRADNLAPAHPPLLSVSSTGDTQEDRRHEKERQLGEGGVRGAESYDCKKIWFSINHSLLSACIYVSTGVFMSLLYIFCDTQRSMRLHRRGAIQGQARVQKPQVFPSNVGQTTSDPSMEVNQPKNPPEREKMIWRTPPRNLNLSRSVRVANQRRLKGVD